MIIINQNIENFNFQHTKGYASMSTVWRRIPVRMNSEVTTGIPADRRLEQSDASSGQDTITILSAGFLVLGIVAKNCKQKKKKTI